MKILVSGVPRRCVRRAFRVRVRVRHAKGLGTVRVLLDRRRELARRKKASFKVRVPARRLSHGRHRLTVRASQRGGRKHVKTVRFRRCR